jgi:hypothetical protein
VCVDPRKSGANPVAAVTSALAKPALLDQSGADSQDRRFRQSSPFSQKGQGTNAIAGDNFKNVEPAFDGPI